MIKIDYEGAWKELRGDMGLTSPNDLYQTINLYMASLEKKHTHDYVDIRKRSDKEVADYCLKKHVELYIKYINLKNKLKKLLREVKGK